MVQGVLLDFDDTILATTATRRPILDAELLRWGATEADVTRMHSRWGLPLRELVTPMIPSARFDEFVEALKGLLASVPPQACLGAEAFLHEVHDRRLPVVIVTSSQSTLVRRDLETLGLSDLIDAVFGSDMTAFHKPSPRIFDETSALLDERWGVDIGRCVYIGDSLSDQACSQGVCEFAAVTSGATTREQFLGAGVDPGAIHDTLAALAGRLWS